VYDGILVVVVHAHSLSQKWWTLKLVAHVNLNCTQASYPDPHTERSARGPGYEANPTL